MDNPYSLLGVTYNASDEEIKKAYYELSKKFHPDNHAGGNRIAERRFREIQDAYSRIQKDRGRSFASVSRVSREEDPGQNDATTAYFDMVYGSRAGRVAGADRSTVENDSDYREAMSLMNEGRYAEAVLSLNRLPDKELTARWFYHLAIVRRRQGEMPSALGAINEAVRREPSNETYRSMKEDILRNTAVSIDPKLIIAAVAVIVFIVAAVIAAIITMS